MFDNDLKQKIINSIQSQQMLEIRYRKVNGEWDEKTIAPYDLYPKRDKNGHERDCLWGCSEKYGQIEKGFSTYLENIDQMIVLDKHFSGREVERILDPKNQPYISRNW